jgi:putative peptidoglycan lipid II flippase
MVAVASAQSPEGAVVAPETAGAGRRIAGAATILLGGFVASRLVGLLRDVVIFGRFGTSGDLDLYYAAFRIPDLVFNLVAGGALGSAIVPVFAEYRAGRGPAALTRLAGAVFNAIGVAACLAALLGLLFAPALVPFLGPGFAPAQQARLALLVRILLLQPVLFGLGEVVTRYLNVRGHFAYPAIAPTLYNLAIIGAALVLGPRLGTVGLALGVVAGALLYVLVQLPRAYALGFRWLPHLDLGEPGLRRIGPLMLPRLIDRGAVQLSFLLTTRLASYLPAGRFAALNLAWVLMMLPLGMFAMSAANAAFPAFSEQAALGHREALTRTIRRTLSSVLFLMVPSALGLVVVGLPLVQTLFQRGRFDPQAAAVTALALAVYALGLPAHGAIEILSRSFYALQDTRTPVALSVTAMGANVLLATLLVGPLGFAGIALAMSVSATLEALTLVLLLRRRLAGLLGLELLSSVGRTTLAGLAMAATAYLTVGAARTVLGLPPVVQLLAAVAVGGATYAGAAYLLRSPELHEFLGLARRRLRGRSRTAAPSTL